MSESSMNCGNAERKHLLMHVLNFTGPAFHLFNWFPVDLIGVIVVTPGSKALKSLHKFLKD